MCVSYQMHHVCITVSYRLFFELDPCTFYFLSIPTFPRLNCVFPPSYLCSHTLSRCKAPCVIVDDLYDRHHTVWGLKYIYHSTLSRWKEITSKLRDWNLILVLSDCPDFIVQCKIWGMWPRIGTFFSRHLQSLHPRRKASWRDFMLDNSWQYTFHEFSNRTTRSRHNDLHKS